MIILRQKTYALPKGTKTIVQDTRDFIIERTPKIVGGYATVDTKYLIRGKAKPKRYKKAK